MNSLPITKREIIAIDVDGTLTESVCFTKEEVRVALPRDGAVAKVNGLFSKAFVIIYTARRDDLIEDTIIWLRTHGFRYHAISNYKMPFDRYYDNDAEHI
jgi:uncharacterized HAD superfamily protein